MSSPREDPSVAGRLLLAAGADPADAEVAALFTRLSSELGEIVDVELALEAILRRGMDLLGARCAAAVLEGRGDAPRIANAVGMLDELAAHLEEAMPDTIAQLKQSHTPLEIELCDRAQLRFLTDHGLDRGLFLPLSARPDTHGALSFFWGSEEGFREEHLPWAPLLAAQAAFALEKARLFESALHQAADMSAFYESAVVGAGEALEPPVLHASILERAAGVAAAHGAWLYLRDPDSGRVEPAAHRGQAAHLPEWADAGVSRAAEEASRSGLVAMQELRGPVDEGGAPDHAGPRRVMAVPLGWRQTTLGALALVREAGAPAFTGSELRRAQLVAHQAANALGIAALVEAERRQRDMSEALQAASLVISGEIELDELLERILDQVIRAFACDAANIQAYEGQRSRVLRGKGYERFGISREHMESLTLSADSFHTLRRMIAGETVIIPDTSAHPGWIPRPGFEWLRSWAGAPILSGREILGFIGLDSSVPGTFNEGTGVYLKAFAAHVAHAMQNARLYRSSRMENERLRQVYQISRNLAASLDPEDILTRLLVATLEALGGLFGVVYLRSADGSTMEPAARWLGPGARADLDRHPRAEALATVVARRAAPRAEELVYAEAVYPVLSFPIVAGDRSYGAAVVWIAPGPLPEAGWMEALAAIGHQAGLALANAHRHAQVQRRVAELTLLQRVANAVARPLQVGSVLSQVTHQLHHNLGYPAVQVYERLGDEMVLRAASGPLPYLSRLPIHRGIIGRVARTGEAALVPDVRKDPDYVAGLLGTRAELAVPILIQGEAIGVINVETSDPGQLDSGALELLTLLADQVSVALQNASLYEQVQRDVETLEDRVRKRTEQLQRVLDQARRAERAKAQFVADVSHELRTPLTNIGLYLDLLEIGAEDRRDDYMTTLRRETERLGALIEQLLALSRFDTDQVELSLRPVAINDLVHQLVADRERLIAQKGIRLQVNLAHDLPAVSADPPYIMQVLTNLLTNAMSYTPAGGSITLETGHRDVQGRPGVALTVADNGPGIPEEEKPHIFDRFYRGLVGRTSGVSGTGLGLAISQEIVDRHSGQISFTSRMGEGTAFSVWLPAAQEGGDGPE
jgi:signal transduction histidine kinase